jgi:hypothetical protein
MIAVCCITGKSFGLLSNILKGARRISEYVRGGNIMYLKYLSKNEREYEVKTKSGFFSFLFCLKLNKIKKKIQENFSFSGCVSYERRVYVVLESKTDKRVCEREKGREREKKA